MSRVRGPGGRRWKMLHSHWTYLVLKWIQPLASLSVLLLSRPISQFYLSTEISKSIFNVWLLLQQPTSPTPPFYWRRCTKNKKKAQMRWRCVAGTGLADDHGAPCGATPAYQLHPPGRLRDAGCHFNHRYPLPSSKSHHQ